jgi:hypothetical protein
MLGAQYSLRELATPGALPQLVTVEDLAEFCRRYTL